MRLRDLDGQFLGDYRTDQDGRPCFSIVDGLDGAQGVQFQCPKCAQGKESGDRDAAGSRYVIGAHYVICWFADPPKATQVADDVRPGPGRWHVQGNGLDDLTFTGPGAASVLLTSGCGWHGFVKDGDAS